MKEKTVFKPLTDVKERAVLVGVILKDQPVEQEMEYLDELAFLAETAGAQTLKSFTQKLDHTDPRTFVGSGKLAEINEFIKANEINLAVFLFKCNYCKWNSAGNDKQFNPQPCTLVTCVDSQINSG